MCMFVALIFVLLSCLLGGEYNTFHVTPVTSIHCVFNCWKANSLRAMAHCSILLCYYPPTNFDTSVKTSFKCSESSGFPSSENSYQLAHSIIGQIFFLPIGRMVCSYYLHDLQRSKEQNFTSAVFQPPQSNRSPVAVIFLPKRANFLKLLKELQNGFVSIPCCNPCVWSPPCALSTLHFVTLGDIERSLETYSQLRATYWGIQMRKTPFSLVFTNKYLLIGCYMTHLQSQWMQRKTKNSFGRIFILPLVSNYFFLSMAKK